MCGRFGEFESSFRGICTGRWRPVARLSEGAVLMLAVAMKDVMAAAGMTRRRPMVTLESSPLFRMWHPSPSLPG